MTCYVFGGTLNLTQLQLRLLYGDDIAHFQATTQGLSVPLLMYR